MEAHKFELLLPQDKIARRIKELGEKISEVYEDKDPILIGVLKGCIIFLADLIRDITIPIELEFISASSYSNGRIPEEKVTMTGGPDISLTGRHLIIVEGVVDSGRTIRTIIDHLEKQEPASVEIVTLLDKPKGRQVEVDIKYKGFVAGEDFVIGFGLDESQKYRNLPFVGKVIEE
jgi:hypoxanthine phosphoribosyltransferase